MNVLVGPKLSVVDKDNLKVWLYNDEPGWIGAFEWNLGYIGIPVKEFEGDHPTEMWEPKKAATVAGGLFAISKQFFMHIGMLDPDFDIWGGEDVE